MLNSTHVRQQTVPGPRPARVVGPLVQTVRFGHDPLGYTRQLFQRYGPVVTLSTRGGTHLYSPLPTCPATVFAYGAEIVQRVTTQHDLWHKYPLAGPLYPIQPVGSRRAILSHFGTGLFGVNGAAHRQQRRLLLPAFHKQRIESYRDDMVAITQTVLDQVRPGSIVDVAALMRVLAMRVATKTLFGADIGEQGGVLGPMIQQVVDVLSSPLTQLLPYDLPGLPYHQLLTVVAQLDDAIRALIVHKRAVGGGTDMLSLLLDARDAESGAVLSEDELLGHAGVLFAAGHETSATALTWTLFLLSQHPRIMADLHDELHAVVQGAAPTVEHLAQLPLLDRVVKESLRVLPPVPWNGRVAAHATELGGYHLLADTEIFVSIYHTHHAPDVFPDPEAFRPQRWETITPSPYAYTPFSAGPRTCIGAGFAMLEIKLVLAILLQRYRVASLPHQQVDRSGVIVLAPKGGLPLQLHPQDRQFATAVNPVQGNIREMVTLPE